MKISAGSFLSVIFWHRIKMAWSRQNALAGKLSLAVDKNKKRSNVLLVVHPEFCCMQQAYWLLHGKEKVRRKSRGRITVNGGGTNPDIVGNQKFLKGLLFYNWVTHSSNLYWRFSSICHSDFLEHRNTLLLRQIHGPRQTCLVSLFFIKSLKCVRRRNGKEDDQIMFLNIIWSSLSHRLESKFQSVAYWPMRPHLPSTTTYCT